MANKTFTKRHKKIYIDTSALESIISKYLPKSTLGENVTIISVAFAFLFVVLTVEKFKDFGGYLTSEQVFFFFLIGTFFFFGLFFYSLYRQYFKKEEILDEIMKHSFNINKNIILFFVTAEITASNGIKDVKILFKKDEDWDMWVLPYHKIKDRILEKDFNLSTLFELINYEFSVKETPSQLMAVDDLEVEEEKISATTDKLTYYSYKSYNLVFNSENYNHLCQNEFLIGERKYKWVSLDSIKRDVKTMDKNKNLITAIDENWSYLLTHLPRSCQFELTV